MKPQILIDSIVRQTTVLLARISTLEGGRSPLAHLANEVFVGLVRELEAQGLGKKVIADMFGLALRSYRQKVHRLGESATNRGMTLWTALHQYISSRESAKRSEILKRFQHDDEASVRGLLNDLVESGLVIKSGRGEDAVYRVATVEELEDLGTTAGLPYERSVASLVWLHVYREGPIAQSRLAELVVAPSALLESTLQELETDGRIQSQVVGGEKHYQAQECLIPIGEAAGWEAAVVDHHRAVTTAIAAKLTSGAHTSAKADEMGGTTLTFDLWPGHPREAEVRALLAATRAQIIPLWEEVSEYNRDRTNADAYQVHFYCGQYLVSEETLP